MYYDISILVKFCEWVDKPTSNWAGPGGPFGIVFACQEVDLEDYVSRPEKISCADIAAICQEAGVSSWKSRFLLTSTSGVLDGATSGNSELGTGQVSSSSSTKDND